MAFGHRAHNHDPIRLHHLIIGFLIVVMGAGLRYHAALGDLWLDEVWSFNLAMGMSAWHEAFWKVIHDNNHPLNTVYLFLVGDGREPWVYRLSSIVAGTATIVVAAWILGRDGAGRALVAMMLAAVLYPLVHFGSEARGYALMILFAYVAFGAVDRARHNPYGMRWIFGLFVMLGVASHLAILPIVFMMCVAYAVGEWRAGQTLWEALKATLFFAAPAAGGLAVVGAGLAYGLKHLTANWYGGRATSCPAEGCFVAALDDITRFSTGGFGENIIGLHAGLLSLLVIGAVVWLLIISQGRAYLYACIFIGAPLIYLALGQPNVPYGRYFIGIFAFLPLIIADVMGALRSRSHLARLALAVAVLALVAANVWSLSQFQRTGRGHYSEAFALITHTSRADTITIGSDMTFRFAKVFDHLARQNGFSRPIHYVERKNITKEHPDWLVTVLVEPDKMHDAICLNGEGDATPLVYRLAGKFPSWGMSGMPWGVYRQDIPGAECP